MSLRSWISPEQLNIGALASNPRAIPWIEENFDEMSKAEYFWSSLSINPSAIHLLEKYPDKIVWEMLSGNDNAIHLLEFGQKPQGFFSD